MRACVRVCARVSSYRHLFLNCSTRIRNNPPSFFQNTNTGFVRRIAGRNCCNCRRYRTVLYGTVRYKVRYTTNGSFSGREDKSPWKKFATGEDGWYPGRKRRFSFLVSPAKRRYISRSLVVRTGTNRTTYRWPVLILVRTNLSYCL